MPRLAFSGHFPESGDLFCFRQAPLSTSISVLCGDDSFGIAPASLVRAEWIVNGPGKGAGSAG